MSAQPVVMWAPIVRSCDGGPETIVTSGLRYDENAAREDYEADPYPLPVRFARVTITESRD
jgi:hypothetical protein